MSFLVVFSPASEVESFELSNPEHVYTIGRDAECDFIINDHLVSRIHAQLRHVGQRWQIEDCGSRNRLKINQIPVEKDLLVTGDLIRVGDSVILFTDEEYDARHRRRVKKISRQTTAVSQVAMDAACHPAAGTLIEQFARKDEKLSGLLGKLATLSHIVHSQNHLVQLSIKTVRSGIAARECRVWLRGADGRLRLANQTATKQPVSEPSLLAALAIENRQGILFGDGLPGGNSVDGGAIAVIIPGLETVRGAIECLKPRESFSVIDLEFLIAVSHIVGLALQNIERIERLERMNETLSQNNEQPSLIGSGPCMQKLLERIRQTAPTDTTILVSGETGTGKELVARMIHEQSRRQSGPLITVNCAAFSDSLLESELFGHEKGAFTGATRQRIGAFERANGGTLFLDEVGEMSLGCQAKILRVLEHYPFERVGGSEPVIIDVRMVAATNRNLSDYVKQQKFRADLMYRLQVIELQTPALRNRRQDIAELVEYFIQLFCRKLARPLLTIAGDALEALQCYHWPGNVRELRNMMERIVVLCQNDQVTIDELQLKYDADESFPMTGFHSIQEMEQRYIQHVLESVNGNKAEACRILGISRATLYNKIAQNNRDRLPGQIAIEVES